MERRAVTALTGSPRDFAGALTLIGDAPLVCIGEATHGTHEFYRARAEITKRLIAERGFMGVCIEGDWPDAYRVNRYVRGAGDDAEAFEALAGFDRFPTWMWRNGEVLDFIAWLREYNDRLNANAPRVGFYGMDLYSLYASMEAVVQYLDRIDTQAAARARARYACLEPYERRSNDYAYALFQGKPSCEAEVLEQLREIQQQAANFGKIDGKCPEDEYFYAEQNARVVANAERYYRSMIDEDESSWNLRDTHMVDTLERLREHLERRVGRCKLVVWAHNSHVGDASVTSMGRRGEINIGSLLRKRHGRDAVLIGFTTHTGTVTAASDWHRPEERKRVRESRADSYEWLFHGLGLPAFYVPLRSYRPHLPGLPASLLERAIGVVYRPETELVSHYFRADILHQFDALFHYDTTRALEPLERNAVWIEGEVPEAYPSGI